MFVAQKKPNGRTLFFAFGEIACGLWAFVAGLLASETWQILFLVLPWYRSPSRPPHPTFFRLGLFENYRLFLNPGLSGEQAERPKECSAKRDRGTLA